MFTIDYLCFIKAQIISKLELKILILWQGNMVPSASKFPSGIKALADYVHGKGLKFGIYSDAGWVSTTLINSQ